MQRWQVEYFFLQKKKYLNSAVKKKVFNLSELQFSEMSSYKIHTLAALGRMKPLVEKENQQE